MYLVDLQMLIGAIGSDINDDADFRESLNAGVLYPYLNGIMNDIAFVNIVNNISIHTDSETNSHWPKILSN